MLELTRGQLDIYLQGKLFGGAVNNLGGYQTYRCELDIPRFRRARDILFEKNDAYRMRFSELHGKCVPHLTTQVPSALRVMSFPTEASALAWMRARFELPFDDISTEVFEDALIQISSGEYWYYAKAHHLVMDGWGFALQMQRLLELYGFLAGGNPAEMAGREAYSSFADYMHGQSGYRESTSYARSLEYWLARHTGSSGILFPRNTGRTPSDGSRRLSVILDARLAGSLQKVASTSKTNLVAVMNAALCLYFSRSYQRRDITISSPVHNRRTAADKDTIGSVVNVVAHRFSVEADTTFASLVEHVASTQRQDYRHSRFPMGDLVRALRERHEPAADALGEISFNYQKLDFRLTAHGQPVDTHYLSHSHERTPLTVVLCDYGEHQDLRLHLDYATACFDDRAASILLERLIDVLQQVSDAPESRLSTYRLLTPTEWQDQFVTWQGPDLPVRENACMQDFFEEQVTHGPNRVAVTCDGASMTYAELDERANRLASLLIHHGAGAGSLVGICHGRSLNLPVAMLAVLKTGAAYVPIDPAYPAARVGYILDDARLGLVVADGQGLGVLTGRDCVVVRSDAGDDAPLSRAAASVERATQATGSRATDIAYVIYTSGSTGQPKGVLVEHRNATAFIQWALATFSATELASVLASTSICFDLSIFELFVTLAAGGQVILVENILSLKDGHLPAISLINTVPSAIRALLDAAAIPTSVRCINLAGESLSQELVDALYSTSGSLKVHDLYGPSETTTYSTYCLRTPGGDTTIGRPIANTQVYVLDESGNPLPTGMTGELYIGGAGLSRGYLDRPDATAEKFRFNSHAGTRLYRTGDMARLTEDGRLHYLGRQDEQLKIRGYRVEAGEIVTCLLGHPSISHCVVVPFDAHGWADGKSLVAYIVEARPSAGEERGPLTAADMAAFLAERLPAYMIPSRFVPLPALPLTPNGKIDRRALPAPGDFQPGDAYVQPANDVERRLSALWQRALKQDRIGVHDNFFARGGDSLLLLELALAIEAEFDVRLDMTLLLASPTIEAQGRLLAQQAELNELLHAVIGSHLTQSDIHVDL